MRKFPGCKWCVVGVRLRLCVCFTKFAMQLSFIVRSSGMFHSLCWLGWVGGRDGGVFIRFIRVC